ncbi:MAG: DoxX family protein [Chitinophagaceae bacterium]
MNVFSTKYNADVFSIGLFILRVGAGVLMINHGYDKFIKFDEMHPKFMTFMGLNTSITLGLVVFAELFCSILLILGLFTRLICIPLIILCIVIVFQANNADVFGKAELGALYLSIYLALLFTGPGKFSIDHLMSKNAGGKRLR